MGQVTAAQIAQWQAAIGREQAEAQVLDAAALQRFGRAVGDPGDGSGHLLAHWAWFLPCPRDSEIGGDGHPERGGFLPAVTLPRRMFAAAELNFLRPLKLGEEARMVSRVADVTHKAGRTGDLVFVEVDRVLWQHGEPCLRERQTYVYREAGAPAPLPQPLDQLPPGDVWRPGEVNLFRFSAATFNGHRIHYDLPYARRVEGYPALVVHGPFTAAKLAGLAMGRGAPDGFAFRALAPLFAGQPIVLRESGQGEFAALRCDGTPAMTARATYG